MTYLAPIPADEQERLRDLYALDLLDTPPEERFDRFLPQIQAFYSVPMAFISFMSTNRQWFKARVGLSMSEAPRDISLCAYTILSDGPLVISDVFNDDFFSKSPLVTEPPFVRFYAACPLHGPHGYRVGTLCMIDFMPREINPHGLKHFKELAFLVEQELNATIYQHQLLAKMDKKQKWKKRYECRKQEDTEEMGVKSSL